VEFVLGELGTKDDETPMTGGRDALIGATYGIETAILLSNGIAKPSFEGAREGVALFR